MRKFVDGRLSFTPLGCQAVAENLRVVGKQADGKAPLALQRVNQIADRGRLLREFSRRARSTACSIIFEGAESEDGEEAQEWDTGRGEDAVTDPESF
ncbi:MAG: hypothetical protein U5L06_01405 [Rhodovibrio sp.]|nr:hypothetical protein [Rhodovibrio sp.]